MIDFMVDGVAKEKLGYSGFETAASQNDLETLGWDAQEDGILSVFAQDLLRMQEEGLLNENVITASYDNQIEAFVTGKAAMISQGVWSLADMQKKAPEFTSIGFAAYPAMLSDSTKIVGNTLDSYISHLRIQPAYRCGEKGGGSDAGAGCHSVPVRDEERYTGESIRGCGLVDHQG